MTRPALPDALSARDGVTCVVGAGGKKSCLYALAASLDRAVVTATVRIPIFDDQVAAVVLTEDPVAGVREAEAWPVGVVPARDRTDRYRGYDPSVVDALAASDVADAVLVKADGARTRLFKAPGANEPRIPRRATTVVPVASVHAVGAPLDETVVHRPERVAALTDRALGEAIRPADLAAVLSHPDGGLRGVPDDARVVPLLNMVDTPRLAAVAADVAAGVFERTDRVSRVVATSLRAGEPVVAVYERP